MKLPLVLSEVASAHANVSCNGGDNGSVTLTTTGGTEPYQYSQDGTNYGVTNVFGNLTAGTHTFYVKDALGCTGSVERVCRSGNHYGSDYQSWQ